MMEEVVTTGAVRHVKSKLQSYCHHQTQVMWMGSKQRLQKIDIGEIPVMSSTVRTVDTARDPGVVIDSDLL